MSQNSSNVFDQPLLIEFQPSRTLLRLAAGLYTVAAIAVLWLQVPIGVHFAVYAVLGAHFRHVYGLHIRGSLPAAVRRLSWDSSRGWRLQLVNGSWLGVVPRTPVFVTRHVAGVRFRSAHWFPHRVIVVADRISPQEFRRLRVRLLQSAHGH